MPLVAPGATLPRTPLGEVAVDYQERNAMIASQILPPHIVDESASEYLFWDPAKAMGLAEVERGSDGKFNRMTREHLRNRAYSCQVFGLEYSVDYFDALKLSQSAFGINSHMTAAQVVDRTLVRRREKFVADLLFNDATFTVGAVEYHKSGPAINKDPDADVDLIVAEASEAAMDQCGMPFDTLVITRKTYTRLGLNNQIKARVITPNFSANVFAMLQRGQIIPDALEAYAQYFQVDRVLIADAKFAANPRNEAGGDPGFTSIWSDDYMLFARVAPEQVDLETSPVLGRNFVWGSASGPDGDPFINPPYTEANILDVVQGYHAYDPQVFNPRCGFLYTDIDAEPEGEGG